LLHQVGTSRHFHMMHGHTYIKLIWDHLPRITGVLGILHLGKPWAKPSKTRVISGFWRKVAENCALLGHYTG